VILLLLVIGGVAAAMSYLAGRRRDPRRLVHRTLVTLFWVGAPSSGIVATRTEFGSRLAIGLAAAWAVHLGALGLVLWRTRRQPGGRRAETMLAVCWPNAVWVGFPVIVLVFGWSALPTAIAFSQLMSGPFSQVVIPGTAAALTHRRGDWRGRLRSFATNPYLPCVGGGYALAALGVRLPEGMISAARVVLLWSTVPAFAAVGGVLAVHALHIDRTTLRLTAARLGITSLPLLALRTVLPIPAPFVLAAAMSVGMGSFQVAAVYRVSTDRLAPALALSTAVVLAAAIAVAALRLV
jgi:predicted permease